MRDIVLLGKTSFSQPQNNERTLHKDYKHHKKYKNPEYSLDNPTIHKNHKTLAVHFLPSGAPLSAHRESKVPLNPLVKCPMAAFRAAPFCLWGTLNNTYLPLLCP